MELTPITQAKAKEFIWKHHRHNIPSIAAVFCVGLSEEGKLIGVAMVGLPKARLLMDGKTLEVTRVAVDGTKNANSMLYGACARAASALGYRQLITYTLEKESGSSLRAAGWILDEGTFGDDNWVRDRKESGKGAIFTDLFGHNHQRIPTGPKLRWRKLLSVK